MSRLLVLAALSLSLGFLAGARLLPASLQDASDIHPEGDHGITRFGPFDAETFQSESAVAVGSEGELKLASAGGLFAHTGHAELANTTPPVPFDSLFIGIDEKCDPGCEVSVQVRVTGADGRTSRWTSVQRESELLLDRPATAFQVRVILSSYTGRETPRVRAVVVQAVHRAEEPVDENEGVLAPVPSPQIVTRALWGARPPRDPYTDHTPEQITVHHSSQPTQANFQGASSIRGIQAFHQGPERGWSDIGYHFLVAPDGKIYEGRPATVVGAHSPANTGKIGCCLIGDFQHNETLTAAQRASLVNLLAYLAGKYKIATSKIKGHRDFQGTDCPGQHVYDQLPQIRKDVGEVVAAAATPHQP